MQSSKFRLQGTGRSSLGILYFGRGLDAKCATITCSSASSKNLPKQQISEQLSRLKFRPGSHLLDHIIAIMAGPPNKRQKREDYKNTYREEGTSELPKKKFYRQRAHANPFSDHQLT